VHVYYLKFADSEDMLPVLLDVTGPRRSTPGRQQRRQQNPPAQPGRNRRQNGSSLRRSSQNRQQQRQRTRPPASGGQQTAVGDRLRGRRPHHRRSRHELAHHRRGAEDFDILRGVIEKLDIRRRQVYVEAIILEVTLDRIRQLGIELQGGLGLPNGVGIGRTNLGNLNTVLTQPGSLPVSSSRASRARP
jgi:type II secretory pathway component GspD/PulD (secretin)